VNVSISELMVVLLIALLVIRPEQMPEVARSLARLLKTGRRLYSKVREEMHGLVEPVEKPNERQ
jgi:Sec-independent protein translocase protein TatA